MRRIDVLTSLSTLVAVAVASGCSGGDDPDGITALEGVYQLVSWTHNPDGCDREGSPADEESSFSHFFVRQDTHLGSEVINAVMCDDLEACRAMASDRDTVYGGRFLFYGGSDDAGWLSESYLLSGQTCDGFASQSVMTGQPRAAVRIEETTKRVSDVPLDDMGECDWMAAERQADGLPCGELTVVTGSYLEAI